MAVLDPRPAMDDTSAHAHDCGCGACCDAHNHVHIDANGGEVILTTSGSQTSDHTALLYYKNNDALRWNTMTDLGTQTVITYSFVDTGDLRNASTDPYGATKYWSYNATQRAQFEQATKQYEAVSGVMFVEVQDEAMVNIFGTSGSMVGGWANIAWSSDTQTGSGILTNAYQSMASGTYGYQINLHELGHAVGLKHPHEGKISLSKNADTQANTVMTYNVEWPYAQDLGPLDITALRDIYGDETGTRGWEVSADAANVVTITASARPEAILATDRDTIIFAGNGRDTVLGREGNDTAHGGFGADVIKGGHGSDTLYGDNGADTLIGGFDKGDSSGRSNERDNLHGGGGQDKLYGGNGADKLFGGGNSDLMVGGVGNDILRGSIGHDTFIGGQGKDILFGGGGADSFVFSRADANATDLVYTFQRALDVLDVSALGVRSMDQLNIRETGGNTTVSFSNWFDVVLMDFELPLSEDNFVFA